VFEEVWGKRNQQTKNGASKGGKGVRIENQKSLKKTSRSIKYESFVSKAKERSGGRLRTQKLGGSLGESSRRKNRRKIKLRDRQREGEVELKRASRALKKSGQGLSNPRVKHAGRSKKNKKLGRKGAFKKD